MQTAVAMYNGRVRKPVRQLIPARRGDYRGSVYSGVPAQQVGTRRHVESGGWRSDGSWNSRHTYTFELTVIHGIL